MDIEKQKYTTSAIREHWASNTTARTVQDYSDNRLRLGYVANVLRSLTEDQQHDLVLAHPMLLPLLGASETELDRIAMRADPQSFKLHVAIVDAFIRQLPPDIEHDEKPLIEW